MKYFALLLALTGCSLETETPTEPTPAPTCPDVQCAWQGNTCTTADSAFGSSKRFEQVDANTACWIYDTVCVPKGTTAECIPDACRREIADCQPDGAARVGGP